jgi:putative ABC transport system permease protein
MAGFRTALSRVVHRLRGRAFEARLDEELQSHLDMLTDDYAARGLSPDEARRAARLRLGGLDQTKEAVRDQRAFWLDPVWQEIRHSLRSLKRSPGFAAVTIITLALAIALATSIFSLVEAVLLRELPYRDADRLVALWATRPQKPAADQQVEARAAGRIFVANTLLDVWRRSSRSFEDIAGFRDRSFTVATRNEPRRVSGEVTTSSFFRVLGLRPLVGRVFADGEDVPGGDEVVVLGHAFWQSAFGADPSIVGRSIQLDGRPHTVIGVLGPEARIPLQYTFEQPALYTPMSHDFAPDAPFSILLGVARLKAGVTRAAAQADLTSVMQRFSAEHRGYRGRGAHVASLADEVVETAAGTRRGLLTLFSAIACVLLMAWVNVANLLLVRATGRHHELAVRMALGARRWRLIRQTVVESLLLSTAAGAVGLLLAMWTMAALVAWMPATLFPRIEEVRIDGAVLAFAVAASFVSGLLAAIAPAWYATGREGRNWLPDWLRHNQGRASTSRGAGLLRRGLVALDVALATVLLVGAGLLGRTYAGLMDVDLGVRPDHALTFRLSPAGAKYQAAAARVALADDVLARLRAISGVAAAGAAESMPIMSWLREARVTVGPGPADEGALAVGVNRVSPGFFEAAGVPIESGRAFDQGPAGAPSAVVSRSMVGRRIGATPADEVGQVLHLGAESYRIGGVAGDVSYRGPEHGAAEVVYLPLSSSTADEFSFVVRTTGPPERSLSAVKAAVRASDPDLPVDALQTMETLRAGLLAPQRFRFALIGLFAGMALLLAVMGLYAVIAQSVSERTREIGVRVALGAAHGRIIGMVLGEAVLLAGLGLAVGIPAALAATRVLSSVLVGVTTFDRFSYVAVTIGLLAVAAVAGFVPARRASAIDPVRALRAE